MPYSDFTLKKVRDELQLTIIEENGLFSLVEEVKVSELLVMILQENVPLALAINTEKARSELIIANVLVELRRQFNHQISLFSGIEFNVNKEQNLNGFCDFLISRSSEQLFVDFPIIAVVEAKNENLISGLGQCIAEMVAAQLFNAASQITVKIYGAVTSGNAWRFLKLEQNQVFLDLKEYHIENVGKVLGILSAMVKQAI